MRRLTSNDRNGAISYWIFENKISSFRKLQDLSNGIFAFKIGLEMTSNEVRKTTRSLSFEFDRSLRFMIKAGSSINRYRVGSLPRYKYTYMYQYAQPRLDSSEHV